MGPFNPTTWAKLNILTIRDSMDNKNIIKKSVSSLLDFRKPDGQFIGPIEFSPDPITFLSKDTKLSYKDRVNVLRTLWDKLNLPTGSVEYDLHHAIYGDFYRSFLNKKKGSIAKLKEKVEHYSDPILPTLISYLVSPGLEQRPGTFNMNIWDTAFSAEALYLSGLEELSFDSVLWLMENQHEEGGWSCSTCYPLQDADTTAAIVRMLNYFQNRREVRNSAQRAIFWLKSLKAQGGGYKLFKHYHGLPCFEVSARVMSAFGTWELSTDENDKIYLTTSDISPILYADHGQMIWLSRQLGIDFEHKFIDTTKYIESLIVDYTIHNINKEIASYQNSNGLWKAGSYIRYIGGIFLNDVCWTQAFILCCLLQNKEQTLRSYVK